MQNSDRCSAYNVGDNVGDNGGKINKPSGRNNTDGIYNVGKHIGGAHTDRKNGKGSSPRFSTLLRAAAVVFWLAVWQFGADAVGTEVLLPSPLAVPAPGLRASTAVSSRSAASTDCRERSYCASCICRPCFPTYRQDCRRLSVSRGNPVSPPRCSPFRCTR